MLIHVQNNTFKVKKMHKENKVNYKSPEKYFYNRGKCLRQVFIEEMAYLIDIISVLIS